MSALPVPTLPADDLLGAPTGLPVLVGGTTAVVMPSALHLVAPLPGLPGHTALRVEALDDAGVLFTLRSPAGVEPALRLFAVAPAAFFGDYAPPLTGAAEQLGLGAHALTAPDGPALALLVVVHPVDETHETPTANLLAPLVIDRVTGAAVQTVLEGDWPLRAALR